MAVTDDVNSSVKDCTAVVFPPKATAAAVVPPPAKLSLPVANAGLVDQVDPSYCSVLVLLLYPPKANAAS